MKKLMSIYADLPCSYVEVEREFTWMNRIKPKIRNIIFPDTLREFMLIDLVGSWYSAWDLGITKTVKLVQ